MLHRGCMTLSHPVQSCQNYAFELQAQEKLSLKNKKNSTIFSFKSVLLQYPQENPFHH